MDNDANNISINILKWDSNYEIETNPLHFHDINLIENVRGIIQKKFKGHEFKNFDELKSLVKSIYDEIPISVIQN